MLDYALMLLDFAEAFLDFELMILDWRFIVLDFAFALALGRLTILGIIEANSFWGRY